MESRVPLGTVIAVEGLKRVSLALGQLMVMLILCTHFRQLFHGVVTVKCTTVDPPAKSLTCCTFYINPACSGVVDFG